MLTPHRINLLFIEASLHSPSSSSLHCGLWFHVIKSCKNSHLIFPLYCKRKKKNTVNNCFVWFVCLNSLTVQIWILWIASLQACFLVSLTALQLNHSLENTLFPISSYFYYLQSSTWPLSASNVRQSSARHIWVFFMKLAFRATKCTLSFPHNSVWAVCLLQSRKPELFSEIWKKSLKIMHFDVFYPRELLHV